MFLDPCENAPICNEQQKVPKFQLKTSSLESYANTYDFCKKLTYLSGLFYPLFDSKYYNTYNQLIEPYDLDICYNSATGLYQYKIKNEHTIKLNVIRGICQNELNNKIVFNNINDFDLSTINPKDSCILYKDFKTHYSYDDLKNKNVVYLIKEVLETHEKIHEEQFKDLIKNVLNMKNDIKQFDKSLKYLDFFNEILQPCKKFNSIEEAKASYKYSFKIVLNNFINRLNREFDMSITDEMERTTHNDTRIKKIIYQFMYKLERKFPKLKCK